ncbi:MAG: family 2 glycosyl transferase [Neptuniibacter caesariensis]|uniref:Family 2 glycosyl transferase n=1 Tax=Neptuniibacter caesariensis TaxID=207954 RepID=A0A2G6JDV5_NEPCE|nr:MAG: family 2 glycosyl transferase [Neptuniibacter caesariensis]
MTSHPTPETSSLIISTYNWPDALNLVLKSASIQSTQPDEIIIADDGSSEETCQLIKHWRPKLKPKLTHIWQEDDGFQLARIRNKAIAAASGDYIISIDGDMVLSPYFVEDHLNAAKPETFVQGGRVMIGPKMTRHMLKTEKIDLHFFSPDIGNRKNTLKIEALSRFLAKPETTSLVRIRGCNQAFWRQQLIAINGFNENIVGWGKEDSDLFTRLINAGYKRRNLKFGGLAYHLHHRQASRDNDQFNNSIFQAAIKNRTIKCENGIDKYL